MYFLYTSLVAYAVARQRCSRHKIARANWRGRVSDCRILDERFYTEIWNRQDFAAAGELLAADFRFRGSLGSKTVGIPAFLAYVRSVHKALADYRCIIKELVADDASQPRA
jgi:SnoaL-like domain